MKIIRHIIVLYVFCAIVLLVGCNKDQQLKGRVTYPDGTPLTAGTIMFSSESSLARSFIDPNGSFDVGSLKEGDGIPEGNYKVFIVGAVENVPDSKNPSGEIIRPLIDGKYTSADTTPLEITIPGNKTFDIVVERPKKQNK